MALLVERVNGREITIIGTVHDEILLEAPSDQASIVATLLQETMIEAGNHFLDQVPVAVEVSVVERWSEK